MNEDLRLAAIEASKLFKKGKYEDAVDVCTLGISDYPQYSSLYLILAKAYIALGDVSEAHKVFESASKFFVNDPLINTLKDILELTPNNAPSVDKKKSKSVIEPTSAYSEPSPIQTIEADVFSKNTDVNIDFQILESIDETISETYSEIIVDETISFESDSITIDDEIEIEQIQEQNISNESAEILASEDWEIKEEAEQIDNEIEIVTTTDKFDDVLLPEPITELDKVTDEEIVDITSDFEEINAFHDELESDYHDVLNEFDSMVSSVEDEGDFEIYDEDRSNYENEVENFDTVIEEIETNLDIPIFSKIVLPTIHLQTTNFIAKAKQGSVNEESLFYIDSVEQAQKVIPHFEVFIHSEQKSHHIEDFNFTLQNPLKSEFFTSISDLATAPLEFQETYQSDRSKYSEIIDFEKTIENLNLVKALFQPIV